MCNAITPDTRPSPLPFVSSPSCLSPSSNRGLPGRVGPAEGDSASVPGHPGGLLQRARVVRPVPTFQPPHSGQQRSGAPAGSRRLTLQNVSEMQRFSGGLVFLSLAIPSQQSPPQALQGRPIPRRRRSTQCLKGEGATLSQLLLCRLPW